MKLTIGSRESKLAVIQSEMVMKAIEAYDSSIETELLTMKTTGDIILDRTLDKIGGKGLFVKELDRALMDERVDLTVHSLKDMPMEIPKELPLLAFSKREDPRDVLILPLGVDGMDKMDENKPIGCSSLRRKLQLERIFPNMRVEPIRGNVQTRLKKLDDGNFSAIVLAYAGVKRLGLEKRVSRIFSVDEILPAAGQGILAVQGRRGMDWSFLKNFNDNNSSVIARAERAFVKTLDGGCSSPVAAYGTIDDGTLSLKGLYVNSENKMFFDSITGKLEDAELLGEKLAMDMKGL